MQLLFVNGRLVRSAMLAGAWTSGYATYAMLGRHPYGVALSRPSAGPRRPERASRPRATCGCVTATRSSTWCGARSRRRSAATPRRASANGRARPTKYRLLRRFRSRVRRRCSTVRRKATLSQSAVRACCRSSTARTSSLPTASRCCSSISTPRTSASPTKRSRSGAQRGRERAAARAAGGGARRRAQRGARSNDRAAARGRARYRAVRRPYVPHRRDAVRLRGAGRSIVDGFLDDLTERPQAARRARTRVGVAGLSFASRSPASASHRTR